VTVKRSFGPLRPRARRRSQQQLSGGPDSARSSRFTEPPAQIADLSSSIAGCTRAASARGAFSSTPSGRNASALCTRTSPRPGASGKPGRRKPPRRRALGDRHVAQVLGRLAHCVVGSESTSKEVPSRRQVRRLSALYKVGAYVTDQPAFTRTRNTMPSRRAIESGRRTGDEGGRLMRYVHDLHDCRSGNVGRDALAEVPSPNRRG